MLYQDSQEYSQLMLEILPVPRAFLGGNLFGYSCDSIGTERVLDTADNLGLRAVDTADVYSGGQSEEFIGNWLKRTAHRENWFIATKTGVTSKHFAQGLASYSTMRSRLEGSLRRLKCEYVDLLQLHHPDPSTSILETIQGAGRLKESGLIRNFGVSNVTVDALNAYSDLGALEQIDYIQVYGNWIKSNEFKKIVHSIAMDSPKVLVYGVLGRGVLTGKYLESPELDSDFPVLRAALSSSIQSDSRDQSVKFLLSAVQDATVKSDISLTEIAIRYISANGGIPVVGCRTPEQVRVFADSIAKADDLWLVEVDRIRHLFRNHIGKWRVSLGEPEM